MSPYQLARRKAGHCASCRPSGIRHSPLYHIYHGMKQRCYNPNNPRYKNYGGRGIYVCDAWQNDYNAFATWARQHGYRSGADLTIDRIDNDGPYSPENCRWISRQRNSSFGNVGKVKHHPHLEYAFGVSPEGIRVDIVNVSEFARVYDLNRSSVSAALNGHKPCEYLGWVFFSNKSRPPRQKV